MRKPGRQRLRRQAMSFGKKVCPVCNTEVKYVFGEDGSVRPLCSKCNVYLDQGDLRPVMSGYGPMDEMEY
jgi:transposase-like protein